ncbi:MAG: universal stress protein [Sphingobacteriales bacterium]|nr:universal stress protein [Sphingobacteriales bacterium]
MKTIVLPFDFSPNARAAMACALQLARSTESGLFVYHVLHESPYKLAAASGETAMDDLIRRDETEKTLALKEEVGKLEHVLNTGIDPERIRVKAEYNPLVVEKTIELAVSAGAGLIVMGTHGASGIRKFLFGSNTAHMIARSPVPVLAIPEHYVYKPVRTLLYASDLEHLEEELGRLIPVAISLHAGIEVLHLDYGYNDKKISNEAAADIIRSAAYQFIQLVTRKASLEKPLLKQVRHYLEEKNPDWLVMFTKEKSMWNKLFIGSRTEDMAQSLQVPLLSFKKPED